MNTQSENNSTKLQDEMIKVVTDRVQEMVQSSEIQKIMLQFSNKQEAIEWVYKAAIATLYIPINER